MIWIGYPLDGSTHLQLAFISIWGRPRSRSIPHKKPTLTVQTSSGDTHVFYGNERALNRLSFMFHHLINNKSMGEVKAKLKAIEEELDGWLEMLRTFLRPFIHQPCSMSHKR